MNIIWKIMKATFKIIFIIIFLMTSYIFITELVNQFAETIYKNNNNNLLE